MAAYEKCAAQEVHTLDRHQLLALFDGVVSEVTFLLISDSWPRFLNSDVYYDFKKQQMKQDGMTSHPAAASRGGPSMTPSSRAPESKEMSQFDKREGSQYENPRQGGSSQVEIPTGSTFESPKSATVSSVQLEPSRNGPDSPVSMNEPFL